MIKWSGPKLFETPRYFNQRDNYTSPKETCFSSTCAMLLDFYKPNTIENCNPYLEQVLKHGKSENYEAQLKALQFFGLKCEYTKSGNLDWLKKSLCEDGNAIVITLLPYGPHAKPDNKIEHSNIVYGYDSVYDMFLLHDPWDLPNFLKGGFIESSDQGETTHYPAPSLKKRWLTGGPNSGKALYPKTIVTVCKKPPQTTPL